MAVYIDINGSRIVFDAVQSISFSNKVNVFDVPVPDNQYAYIMNLGGVSRNIRLSALVVSDNLPDIIKSLVFDLTSGEMLVYGTFVIEEWDLSIEVTIQDVSVSQNAGEPGKVRVDINMLVGKPL